MNTRNHGGKRAGSGGKRGSIYAPTRRKQALLAEWQAAVALRFDGMIEAQLRAAVGDSAVFAKSPDGAWAHIPDREGLALGVGEALMPSVVRPNSTIIKSQLVFVR